MTAASIVRPVRIKKICIVCNKNKPNSKEHVFPIWMLKLTNTQDTKIPWLHGEKIKSIDCTMPICSDCNRLLNLYLEIPFKKVFTKLKSGKEISDYEAEITVRWMWKVSQLFWLYGQNNGYYEWKYSLKERCLTDIDIPRNRISLAICRTKLKVKNSEGNEPMGLDVIGQFDSILSAGVFSNVSILILSTKYLNLVPKYYTLYTLKKEIDKKNKAISAKIGFKNSYEAVQSTRKITRKLLYYHETDAINDYKILNKVRSSL